MPRLPLNATLKNIVLLQSFSLFIKIIKIGFGFSQRNVYTGPFAFVPRSTFRYFFMYLEIIKMIHMLSKYT